MSLVELNYEVETEICLLVAVIIVLAVVVVFDANQKKRNKSSRWHYSLLNPTCQCATRDTRD